MISIVHLLCSPRPCWQPWPPMCDALQIFSVLDPAWAIPAPAPCVPNDKRQPTMRSATVQGLYSTIASVPSPQPSFLGRCSSRCDTVAFGGVDNLGGIAILTPNLSRRIFPYCQACGAGNGLLVGLPLPSRLLSQTLRTVTRITIPSPGERQRDPRPRQFVELYSRLSLPPENISRQPLPSGTASMGSRTPPDAHPLHCHFAGTKHKEPACGRVLCCMVNPGFGPSLPPGLMCCAGRQAGDHLLEAAAPVT